MRKVKDDTGHEHGADGKFTSGGGGGGAGKGKEKGKDSAKPKKVSLVAQARSMKLSELKELPLSKLRSMQTALQKPAWPEDEKKNKKALRFVEGAIYSKV